jgi:flagellar biosynthesis protein FlhG
LRLLERALASLPPLPLPTELVRHLARLDVAMAKSAALELQQFLPRLVVNGVRSRAETELGQAVSDMSQRYLGVELDYIGHIERDDTVSLSVSRRQPLLIDSPTTKAARNIERIARRVLALAARKPEQTTPEFDLVASEPTLYDVLLTHRGASDEELRRAFKRQREIYALGSLPLTSLVSDAQQARAQALINEAHDTLLDPLRRRAYDLSTFPDAALAPKQRDTSRDAALEAERALMREELAAEVTPQTSYTGPLLRKIRESMGIELTDISARTKISVSYLVAIEEERFNDVPAFVYLRGFVTEIAKFLKLDVTQVTRTYLRRYRTWKTNHDVAAER